MACILNWRQIRGHISQIWVKFEKTLDRDKVQNTIAVSQGTWFRWIQQLGAPALRTIWLLKDFKVIFEKLQFIFFKIPQLILSSFYDRRRLLKWTHGIFSSECTTFYNIKDILHVFESILREESVTCLHSLSENQKN